jgi:hypothetical protein
MNGGWCPWSIPLHEGLRNRPYSLRCDFTVSYLILPPFKCLSAGQSSNTFRDPIDCRLGKWTLTDSRVGPHWKYRFQEFLFCWVFIRWYGNLFIELLLSNGCVLQSSCHNTQKHPKPIRINTLVSTYEGPWTAMNHALGTYNEHMRNIKLNNEDSGFATHIGILIIRNVIEEYRILWKVLTTQYSSAYEYKRKLLHLFALAQ